MKNTKKIKKFIKKMIFSTLKNIKEIQIYYYDILEYIIY